MVDLSGLSAVYPGFLAAQHEELANRMDKSKATSLENDLAGQAAYGRTLMSLGIPGATPMPPGMMAGGPQGPQAPAPGQPSMPMQHPMMAQQQGGGMPAGPMPMQPGMPQQGSPGSGGMPIAPMQQQGPMAGPQSGGQPMGLGPGGRLDWRAIANKVTEANPGAQPQIIAAAVDRFVPLMNAQSQQEWRLLSLQLRQQSEQGRNDRFDASEDRKSTQFDAREERLKSNALVRQDQGYQRLEVQKQDLARKAQAGGDKLALSQWRAVVDAQNKRANEVIRANMMGKPSADVQAVLDEQNNAYTGEINDMKSTLSGEKQGNTTITTTVPAGASKTPNKETSRLGVDNLLKSQGETPAGAGPPPEALSKLKEGVITIFANGQRWTLQDGKPQQLPPLK